MRYSDLRAGLSAHAIKHPLTLCHNNQLLPGPHRPNTPAGARAAMSLLAVRSSHAAWAQQPNSQAHDSCKRLAFTSKGLLAQALWADAQPSLQDTQIMTRTVDTHSLAGQPARRQAQYAFRCAVHLKSKHVREHLNSEARRKNGNKDTRNRMTTRKTQLAEGHTRNLVKAAWWRDTGTLAACREAAGQRPKVDVVIQR